MLVTGICGILGSTYTGEYEDIEKLDRLVEKLNKEKVSPIQHDDLLGLIHCEDTFLSLAPLFVYVAL